MTTPTILIVETDIIIRSKLAEYLRDCGYAVLEALNADETRAILDSGEKSIDAILLDTDAAERTAFTLATWIRAHHKGIDVILAGTIAAAAQKAGELCREGPAIAKPYNHQHVLDYIKRQLAARQRVATPSTETRAGISHR